MHKLGARRIRTADELSYYIDDCRARLAVVDEAQLDKFVKAKKISKNCAIEVQDCKMQTSTFTAHFRRARTEFEDHTCVRLFRLCTITDEHIFAHADRAHRHKNRRISHAILEWHDRLAEGCALAALLHDMCGGRVC
jgi:hypothetical protein